MNYLDLPHQLAVAEDCGRLAADGRNDGAIERLTSVLRYVVGVNNGRVHDSFVNRELR